MKKLLACGLAVVLLALTLALPASAMEGYQPNFEISAEAAYIVNTDTNIVVYQKNGTESMSAASVTKLMTIILMLENYQDQLDAITVTAASYIYDVLYGMNASTADIRAGETQSLRNLLYAMALPSGNEAAYMVADYMGGGSVSNFVAMMNDEARRMGCTGTTFTDPCGLDPGNVTTAQDAYLMLRTAMSYDAFVAAAAEPTYDMGANERYTAGTYIIQNTDKMINPQSPYYRSYTQGGKTGTLEDWQNFVSWHTQNGETYICAVLHSPLSLDEDNKRPALLETGELMDWVFDTFTIATALDTTQPISEIPIVYSSETDTLMLYPADAMMTLLPKNGTTALTQQHFNLPGQVTAPIRQGDAVGTVTITINGETLGTVDLIAGSDVSRNQLLYTLARIGEFFGSTYFRMVVLLTMLVIGIYAFMWVLNIILRPGRRR